jgi:hypothetical protein
LSYFLLMSRGLPILLLALCGCGEMLEAKRPTPAPAQPAVPANSGANYDEIAKVLDDWHDAAAKADEQRYFDHFAEGAVFLGTDPKERWTLPEFQAYAHPHFAAGKAWNMIARRREITFHDEVAWFDEDLVSEGLGEVRGSGVLVRSPSGRWLVAQYNLSVPIPNERFKDVRALMLGGSTSPSASVSPAPGTPQAGCTSCADPGSQP